MYNLDYELKDGTVSQLNTFISKTNILRIRLKTYGDNIRNAKLVLNNLGFYMTKSGGYYTLPLYKNMVHTGINSAYFVLEDTYGRETITASFDLTVSDKNYIHEDFNYIDYLIPELNRIISKL